MNVADHVAAGSSGRPPIACVFALPSRRRKVHYGLFNANEGFLESLIRYSSFEEIHLFVRELERQEMQASLNPIIKKAPRPVQVTTIPVWHLPDFLARFDYAGLHWGDPFIAPLAGLRNAFARRPCPVTGITHSLSVDQFLERFGTLAVADVRPYDAIICSSPAAKEALRRILAAGASYACPDAAAPRPFPAQLVTIPLGLDPGPEPAPARPDARRSLGLPPDGCIILTVGRISVTGKMDLHPALLALQRLIQDHGHRRLTLVIAGSVNDHSLYLDVLMKRAADLGLTSHILIKANFDTEDRRLLYAAADIFLSLSDNIQESFGLAPVEAMLHSLPCVLSDWDGYHDLVADGETGFLIPTYWTDLDAFLEPRTLLDESLRFFLLAQFAAADVSLLTRRLDELIRQPALRDRIGTRARAAAEARFHWKVVIQAYEALWDSLRKEARRHPAPASPPAALRNMHPYRFFSHYPTRALDAGFQVAATARGRRALAGDEKPVYYRQLREILRAPITRMILENAQAPAPISQIQEQCAVPKAIFDYHLLWMLKHDLLEAVP